MYGDAQLTLGGTNVVYVEDGATLTINGKNVIMGNYVDVDKDSKFVLNATNVNATAHGISQVAGTLEIGKDAVVDCNNHTAIVVKPNATVTLSGSIKNANNVVAASTSYKLTDEDKHAVVTVNGGTYTTKRDAFIVDKGYELNIVNVKKVTASGRILYLIAGKASISAGEFVATSGTGLYVKGTDEDTSLTVNGGKVTSNGTERYALTLANPNATYVISNGTFESRSTKGVDAIGFEDEMFDAKTGKLVVKGILTGGKYLNNIASAIKNPVTLVNYDLNTDLVAEGYTVKEEVVGKDTYKVIVSTKAEDDKKPATKPEEQAPNTYDAGLVYMGLALSAIGASVVSVRKLRNN